MRDIEIKILDQSNVISVVIAKKKKLNVKKIIDDLFSLFFKYVFIDVLFRKSQPHELFKQKQQTFWFLFRLFIFFNMFQIIANQCEN